VVFEHAQKFSTSGKRFGFQPPVRNWWKISDISKKANTKTLINLKNQTLLFGRCLINNDLIIFNIENNHWTLDIYT